MTSEKNILRFGPLGANCVHLCVDMQRLFAEETAWHTPWMNRVLPAVVEITAKKPERTVFTRFIPAKRPGQGQGTWRRYYERWSSMTLAELDPGMIDLLPDLARFVPPATVIDKHVYGPWLETDLHARLQKDGIDTLIMTGGETDVCIMATISGAIDLGYRIIVVTDGVCSCSDDSHDAAISLYHQRYGMQVEPVPAATILSEWR